MKMNVWITSIALILLVASGAIAKAAPPDPYLIGLRAGSDLTAQGISGVKDALVREVLHEGGEVTTVYQALDLIAARLTPEAMRRLEGDPRVSYIAPDGRIAAPDRFELDLTSGSPVELYPWGVQRVHAPEVHRAETMVMQQEQAGWDGWQGPAIFSLLGAMSWFLAWRRKKRPSVIRIGLGLWLIAALSLLSGCSWSAVWPHSPGITGQGVNVVLLDTGIDLQHPNLSPNYAGGYDFVNRKPDPQDDNGHGTAVAGVLAAAENGNGLIGVAPNASIWEFKILDANEEGSISDLLRGLDWAIIHHAQIVNMSLGTPDDNQALHNGITRAALAGILMTAASGNKGDAVLFPAAYPEVIAVAATTPNDQIAWFSNQGPQVELAAPGVNILSTALHGKYGIVNGTSFAAPHVAGVAALLFSAGLRDPIVVRKLMDETADDLGLPLNAQGHGLVNAWRAYQRALKP
jgi:subtilisin family serine protease